ncbi:MAG TPA: fused MFS/spermidine synthase [Rhizomicrobium sp.]
MKRTARPPRDEIAICQDNAAGYTSYVQDSVNQSRADANGVSLADYIHVIFGLVLQSGARRVLMIGCGGGTLATMLHARDVKVAIVDINAASFMIARRHFRLPRGVMCHVADGVAFLRDSERRYDAIVLDAYAGKAIPGQFLTPDFMTLVKLRLAGPDAFFIVNVIAAGLRDRTVRRVERLMETEWPCVRVMHAKSGGSHNALVMAGAVAGFKRPKLEMPPLVGRGELRKALNDYAFRN